MEHLTTWKVKNGHRNKGKYSRPMDPMGFLNDTPPKTNMDTHNDGLEILVPPKVQG